MMDGKGSRIEPVNEKPGVGVSVSVSVVGRVGCVRWKGKRGQGRTENSVYDMICFFQCRGEIFCEWDIEVLELS